MIPAALEGAYEIKSGWAKFLMLNREYKRSFGRAREEV
jgi:hypothetical protein